MLLLLFLTFLGLGIAAGFAAFVHGGVMLVFLGLLPVTLVVASGVSITARRA